MKYNLKKKYQIALRRLYETNLPCKEIKNMVGIDHEGFIAHINKYRIPGMTDENFGLAWGIDHIVPVDVFDLTDKTDLNLCYNYNNLMPMFNEDNRLKGASLHFSVAKLATMYTNVFIEMLKDRANLEITRIYQKYLLPS